MSLPPEARKGVERAFLEILRKRHPGVTWTIVPPEKDRDAMDALNEARDAYDRQNVQLSLDVS